MQIGTYMNIIYLMKYPKSVKFPMLMTTHHKETNTQIDF